MDQRFDIPAELDGKPLDGAVRALTGSSWSEARKLIATGKVHVGGAFTTDARRPVRAGEVLAIHPRAPRPHVAARRSLERDLIIHCDAHVVVVRKPAGISTVPFGDEPPGERTLDALVRDVLAHRDRIRGRAPLGIVHRLDKQTSGVLVFTRTLAAKKDLAQQFRQHTVFRRYLAIAHGAVRRRTFRSRLVADRGDGLRGSLAGDARSRGEGQLAITHVEPIEALDGATLIACRLETGRTHQIRIHLSEAGHPLVGETVYVRDYRGRRIEAPRLMLHAAELGFVHPGTGEALRFEDPPPPDFEGILAALRTRR